MPLDLGNVYVKIGAKTEELEKKLKSASDKMEKFASKARAASLKATAAIAAVGLASNKLVQAASDAEELDNVIQQAFGNMAGAINGWAKDTGKAMGRSTYQMRQFAGVMQAVIKPMVGSEKAAADMSKQLAKLAVDMGSFWNVADEEAFNALRSGLVGETEPLRRFGIVLTETQLEAWALAKGIKANVQTMTEAEKVQLRYQFILDRTTDVQGDAVRTADSYANQVKALQSDIRNLSEDMGKRLMPVFKDAVALARRITARFDELDGATKDQIVMWGKITVAVLGGIAAFGLIATAAAIAVKGLALLGGVLGIITSPVVLGLGLIALGSATLKTAWDENWGGIRDKTLEVWKKIEPVYGKFKEWVKTAWTWTIETAGKAWGWIVDTAWQEKLEDIKNWLSTAWTWTINKAGDAWQWLENRAPGVTNALETAWTWAVKAGNDLFTWIKDTAWPYLKEAVPTWWDWSVKAANELFNFIVDAAKWFGGTVTTTWHFTVTGLEWINETLDKIRSLISGKNELSSLVFTDRKSVIGNLPNIPSAITTDDRGIWQKVSDWWTNWLFDNGMHSGGLLPGTSGGDKFPALLAPGEAVVPASAVNAGPVGVAEWFRSMGAPGFAEGYFPRSLGGQFSAASGWLDELGEGLSQITETITDSFKRFFSWLGDALITLVEKLFPDLAPKLKDIWDKDILGFILSDGYEGPGRLKHSSYNPATAFHRKPLEETLSRWQQFLRGVRAKYSEFQKLVKGDENAPGLNQAVYDMADAVYRFNAEAADAIGSFQEIIDLLADIPIIASNITAGMGAAREQIASMLGGGKIGDILGTLGAGYLGAQAFSQGSGGGTNLVGAVGGFMSALPGPLGEIGGAMAAGSSLVNALFPGKDKNKDDQALQSRIKDMNKTLAEWGADFQSENLWFKKDSGFLGWRNLFGNQKWSTMNKEAAERGAEIAERLINSMTTTFQQLGQGLGEILFSGGSFDDFGKFVGRRLQQVLIEEMLMSAAIKEPLQRLSAFMAEAVMDGLTKAEITQIKEMAEAVFDGLAGWSDVAADIAEQFGLAEDAANGITGALRNVPSGFKLAFSEFAAAQGIPALASGGIVTRPTLAMVGEAGPEAVVPLDGRGAGLTVNINGDVYGYDDFKRKVAQATGEINRSSSLARVGVG